MGDRRDGVLIGFEGAEGSDPEKAGTEAGTPIPEAGTPIPEAAAGSRAVR